VSSKPADRANHTRRGDPCFGTSAAAIDGSSFLTESAEDAETCRQFSALSALSVRNRRCRSLDAV
jgi:hypothetical protein